jgi:hypothetical protein
MRNIGTIGYPVEVGERYTLRGEPVTVMGIETNHILVSFENTQQYGTGTRKWLTHDHFANNAAVNTLPNTNPWPA